MVNGIPAGLTNQPLTLAIDGIVDDLQKKPGPLAGVTRRVTRDTYVELRMSGEHFTELLRRAGLEMPGSVSELTIVVGKNKNTPKITPDAAIELRWVTRESDGD